MTISSFAKAVADPYGGFRHGVASKLLRKILHVVIIELRPDKDVVRHVELYPDADVHLKVR